MIRNVVLGRLRDDLDPDQRQEVDAALAGIAGLRLPGQVSTTSGPDLGLRDGGWSFAIVNDWQDADAYANYDADPEHNGYRSVIGAACADLARVQFEIVNT